MSNDKIDTETITTPDNLVNNIQIQQAPKPEPSQEPIPTSDTTNHGTIPDQTSQEPLHQTSPILTPLNDNQPTYFDYQQNGLDQKPVTSHAEQQPEKILQDNPFSLPTASSPLSGSFDQHTVQDQKPVVMPAEQQNFSPGKGLPYNPVTLPSSQSPMNFGQQSGHSSKPMVTLIAEPLVQNGQFHAPVMSNQPPTTLDQHIQTEYSMGPFTSEHTKPNNNLQFNASPLASGHHSPGSFDQQTMYNQKSFGTPQKQQTVQPVKSVIPNNPFSTSPVLSTINQNEDDQKPRMVAREIQRSNKSLPNDQFNAPFNPPSSAVDQKHRPCASSVVISSANETEDLSLDDFPSVVPPVLIPLSKVGQYLPEGMAMVRSKTWIPLPLKPVIVLKDQVAVMVFEPYDG